METKWQLRKDGILSGFFDAKWNFTWSNFLTPKDLQLDGKALINALNFSKQEEICLHNPKVTNNIKVDGKMKNGGSFLGSWNDCW